MRPLLIVFYIFYSISSYATLDFEDHAFPEFVTSARALAMGNAFINKVDDSWSAFYNPAGLGTVRRPQFHLANGHLEMSSNMLQLMNARGMSELRNELVDKRGQLVHSRFNFYPNFTVRGLTLGYFYSQRNRAILNDDSASEFEVAERRDQGPVLSLNASLFGGVFKIGATAIYLNRSEVFKSFEPTEEVEIKSGDYQSGKSLQLTTGARLVLPYAAIPTFSAVLRNATDNDFEDVKHSGAPDKIKQTIDLGFSLTPQVGKRSRLHFELNLKDVSNKYKADLKRRAAAGVELDFMRRFFIRAGSGDGWGSGGIGYRHKSFVLDMTTYAVDRSQDGFRELEDRRWVLAFAFGI